MLTDVRARCLRLSNFGDSVVPGADGVSKTRQDYQDMRSWTSKSTRSIGSMFRCRCATLALHVATTYKLINLPKHCQQGDERLRSGTIDWNKTQTDETRVCSPNNGRRSVVKSKNRGGHLRMTNFIPRSENGSRSNIARRDQRPELLCDVQVSGACTF